MISPERARYLLRNKTEGGALKFAFVRKGANKRSPTYEDGVTQEEDAYVRKLWSLMPNTQASYFDTLIEIAKGRPHLRHLAAGYSVVFAATLFQMRFADKDLNDFFVNIYDTLPFKAKMKIHEMHNEAWKQSKEGLEEKIDKLEKSIEKSNSHNPMRLEEESKQLKAAEKEISHAPHLEHVFKEMMKKKGWFNLKTSADYKEEKSIRDLLPEDLGESRVITKDDFDEIDQGVKIEENAAPTQPNYTTKIVAPNKATTASLKNKLTTSEIKLAKEIIEGTKDLMDHMDLYDKLFNYYSTEIPYGTQKARTGDPVDWIVKQLGNEDL